MLSRRPRVLVADDEVDNVELLRELLVDEGFEVFRAFDGEEALDKVRIDEPDLLLLDVMMPGLDGFAVCRRIREDPRTVGLPVVMLTASRDYAARIAGKEAGCDDFLTKPFVREELLARARSLLRRKSWTDSVELERDRLREQLLRAERLVTLGTLAGGVGHELGNIAAVLNSVAREVSACAGIAPDVREDLESAARHVTAHARNLLSLARPGPEREEAVDMAALAAGATEMLTRCGRARDVDIRIAPTPEPAIVRANRTRLEQVLMNLLANAADAASERPRARRVEVRVRFRRAGDRLHVLVEDDGPGMPSEVAARVFEPYFTTKPAGRGTGLGLPVVRQIVESYGGALAMSTEPGRGTSFSFDLPAMRAGVAIASENRVSSPV